MGQAALARRAVVRRDAIADFENGSRTLSQDNLAAIMHVLEESGVEFTNGNQPGVRLRKPPNEISCPKGGCGGLP
jgi:hypothetical protein